MVHVCKTGRYGEQKCEQIERGLHGNISTRNGVVHHLAGTRVPRYLYRRGAVLVGRGAHRHAIGMFVVTEADAAAIRDVFHQEGELSAAIELRRRFPGITDNAKARACARTIAGWTPRPEQPRPVTRLRPRRGS